MGDNFFWKLRGVELAVAAKMTEKPALLGKKVEAGDGPNWFWAAGGGLTRAMYREGAQAGNEGKNGVPFADLHKFVVIDAKLVAAAVLVLMALP